MDHDLALVIGIVLGVLSVPSVLSAFSDRRAPRASAITILIAGSLIVYAAQNKPNGISLDQIPDIFVNVIGRYLL
ncbi:hypothetical protein C1J02_19200 [Sulfitobacter sp. SK011]|jgi:hypothetical protein|nr:hypothetical protein [Sulfitobacter sp. SK011]AXI43811.1 hypothetical protein C1J02_19200 [Sulfitobacter sp. SK011]